MIRVQGDVNQDHNEIQAGWQKLKGLTTPHWSMWLDSYSDIPNGSVTGASTSENILIHLCTTLSSQFYF